MTPEELMARAVELSAWALRIQAGGPFGAVVAKRGELISEGWNRVTSVNDPTAHAEIVAIRGACRALATFDLSGCELYTSCEPCPMCLAAGYWARLDRVYYANTREEAAAIGFDDLHFYRELALGPEQRSLPMTRIETPGALDAFQAWAESGDKTPY
jgi:guanine deaminase